MRKNNCKVVRRELDELMLDQACSTDANEHLRDCASCSELHEQQTKLRQIVGSLGTVEAPADFDFRLRARLAQGNGSSVYWPFARRGLAVAAMVIVFVAGVVVVRSWMDQSSSVNNVARQPEVQAPAKPEEVTPVMKKEKEPEQVVAAVSDDAPPVIRKDDRRRLEYKKRRLSAIDLASERAEVINGAEPVGVSTAFPIDASHQSFTVSLDDGRGNAKTISVPTISFGSQRMVQSGNQLAPKRVW